jgi:hypothetical protein
LTALSLHLGNELSAVFENLVNYEVSNKYEQMITEVIDDLIVDSIKRHTNETRRKQLQETYLKMFESTPTIKHKLQIKF